MSTDFFRKYINIIEEAQQLDELSPDLLRRASDAATARGDSLTGPENKAARQKARGQEEKFYQGQVDRSNANPVAGTQATANAYAEKLKQNGWNQITNPQQIQQAAASLGWDKYSQPPQGVTWFTHSQSGEAAYIDPKNGQLVRSNNTQQRVGHSFGNAKSMHPAASDSQKWNANNPNQNIFQPTEDVTEGFTDTLKSIWRGLKGQVVDIVANAVGLPDDQRREVFVQAGNEFSNEVIKLLANHPARDKLIPMVREIGGYMAKARTVEELKSLMDKAGLFLADVEAGKFNPPSGVAKTLPSYRDKQGVAEGDYPDGSSIRTPGADEWKQQYQQAVMAVKNAKTQQEYEAASDRASRIKDLLASKGIQVGPVLGQQGVAEESVDEASTPDAVRRIEQLVQYK